jgi:uncharacterized protein (TIGR02996 family)
MSDEASSTTLRQALEESLAENPDDLATHMAYADHLMEQGDPLGEFIQVQLALLLGSTTGNRDQLHRRERELALAHHRDWLGPLAEPVLGGRGQASHMFQVYGLEGANGGVVFARGWLDRLHVKMLEPDLATALVAAPQTRLLRQLTITSCRPNAALAKPRFLGNVRILHIGSWREDAPWVVEPVRHMPRLEELRLQVFGFRVIELLRLPALANVRVLTLAGMTNQACQWLSHAEVLKQLRILDLRHSEITDEGARFLAAAPDLKHLDCLDIRETEEVSRRGWERLYGVLGNKLKSDYRPAGAVEDDLFESDAE